jgi:hypothetical protein
MALPEGREGTQNWIFLVEKNGNKAIRLGGCIGLIFY